MEKLTEISGFEIVSGEIRVIGDLKDNLEINVVTTTYISYSLRRPHRELSWILGLAHIEQ